MAVVATLSNHFKYLKNTKAIDFTADNFRVALMSDAYAFDKDAHEEWADVSASEIANGNGYTTGGALLANIVNTEDDVNDRFSAAWDAVTWTASGGAIGPSGSAIIYDDTVTGDPIVGCIDFGVDITAADGTDFEISSIEYRDS